MSSLTSLSLNCRLIKRLKAKTVFCEFTTACHLAGRPTIRSPCLVNATTEGLNGPYPFPSSLTATFTVSHSKWPVFPVIPHLLVVELPTNQTLEGKDSILRVHDCLSFFRQTNQTLEGKDSILRVHDCLSFFRQTNQTLEGKDSILRVHDCLSFFRQTNNMFATLEAMEMGGLTITVSSCSTNVNPLTYICYML